MDVDTGLKDKNALVCASSRGLGRGCAEALAREGVALTLVARNPEPLDAAARAIRAETGVSVTTVAADITTDAGRRDAVAACPDPDILVTNAGGPPPGDFRQWDSADWHNAVEANMITPIELIKAVVDGMIDRGFGRILNITSSSVKAPIPELGLSNGARSGLTGFVAGLARQVARHNVTINNLLPGRFDTDRLASIVQNRIARTGEDRQSAREAMCTKIPAGRFGDPAEFGLACAFLCSAGAGYITGQNLLIDGGAYPGTF